MICNVCNQQKVCVIGNFWLCSCDKRGQQQQVQKDQGVQKDQEVNLIWDCNPAPLIIDPNNTQFTFAAPKYSFAGPTSKWIRVTGNNGSCLDFLITDDWEQRWFPGTDSFFSLVSNVDVHIYQSDLKPHQGFLGLRITANVGCTLYAPPYSLWIKKA